MSHFLCGSAGSGDSFRGYGKIEDYGFRCKQACTSDPLADSAAGIVLKNQAVTVQETNIQLLNTVKNDASVEGNGDGNGQVPPRQ